MNFYWEIFIDKNTTSNDCLIFMWIKTVSLNIYCVMQVKI